MSPSTPGSGSACHSLDFLVNPSPISDLRRLLGRGQVDIINFVSNLGTRMDWDLAEKGLSVHAVLSIKPQRSTSDSVLFDFWEPVGPNVRIYLDSSDSLFLELSDRIGAVSRVGPVKPEHFLDRSVYLRAVLAPEPTGVHLSIAINNRTVAESSHKANLGPPGTAAHTLGSARGHMNPSTFSLAELVVAGSAPNHNDDMWQYFRDSYDLKP